MPHGAKSAAYNSNRPADTRLPAPPTKRSFLPPPATLKSLRGYNRMYTRLCFARALTGAMFGAGFRPWAPDISDWPLRGGICEARAPKKRRLRMETVARFNANRHRGPPRS